MKIGLIRHFKVNHPFPNKFLLLKSDVRNWFEEYDRTENLQYKDWFVMWIIRQELFRRGFVGHNFKSNEYGTLYGFENTDK